ncbi:hypothetical protein [Pseudomonas orientalis]|uniref:hypothetical protein n=1 Tax=Pseudomonas orientalis TaxID=76758 RepID=UPI002FE3CB73
MTSVPEHLEQRLKDLHVKAKDTLSAASVSPLTGAELHEMYAAVNSGEADLYDSRLQELKTSAQGQGKSIVESWRETILDLTKSFEQSGFAEPNSYIEALEDINGKVRRHADSSLGVLFDQARRIISGADSPLQQEVMRVMDKVSSLITHIAGQIMDTDSQIKFEVLSGKKDLTDLIDRMYRGLENNISRWF